MLPNFAPHGRRMNGNVPNKYLRNALLLSSHDIQNQLQLLWKWQRAIRDDRIHPLCRFLQFRQHDGAEDVLLRCELAVERLLTDADSARNLARGNLRIAMFQKQLPRRIDDARVKRLLRFRDSFFCDSLCLPCHEELWKPKMGRLVS